MADASPKPSETERIRGRWNARDAAKAIEEAGRKRPSTRPPAKESWLKATLATMVAA